MYRILYNKNFYFILLCDIFFIVLALYLSYAIRFDFVVSDQELSSLMRLLPVVLLIKLATFFGFTLYHGMWRYTSLEDLFSVIKAVSFSTIAIIAFILMRYRFQNYPRSVFIIDWGLTLFFVSGVRLAIRLYFAPHTRFRLFSFWNRKRSDAKRLLIIGAGNTGEKVLREILQSPQLQLIPVGFLDDDAEKHGKTIHGIKVLGGVDELESYSMICDEVLIALSLISGSKMRRIVNICKDFGKEFRIVPAIGELIDRKFSMKLVRNVTIRDLLDRKEVRLNEESISQYLRQKRVLVTGAGGSIGSELVRQIQNFRPESLAFLDVGEYNLFQITMAYQSRHDDVRPVSFLTDIRDRDAIDHVFQQFQPQVVFHAAAYKHVPIQELFPWEAVKNNILGTRNLIRTAQEHHVEKFVLVSSDKAVHPTNVMGATKRVAEMLTASANLSPTSQFIAVRFGNVIGSSGSVIPIFQEQIARGGPVTVTHPEVTRYFMSIPEAAQLILQAGSMGKGGEIFILDMGNPVRIADLARDLIRLYGYEPEKDIDIQYIGLRPGEKLYEELITSGEGIVETQHEDIMVLQANNNHFHTLHDQVDELLEIAGSFDAAKLKQHLQKIVPEYTPA